MLSPERKRLLRAELILAGVSVAVFLAMVSPGWSQPACSPYDRAAKFLKEKYNEEPVGGGVVNDTTIVQRFASPDGSTFTIITVRPDGMSCMVMSGKDWEETPTDGKGV